MNKKNMVNAVANLAPTHCLTQEQSVRVIKCITEANNRLLMEHFEEFNQSEIIRECFRELNIEVIKYKNWIGRTMEEDTSYIYFYETGECFDIRYDEDFKKRIKEIITMTENRVNIENR